MARRRSYMAGLYGSKAYREYIENKGEQVPHYLDKVDNVTTPPSKLLTLDRPLRSGTSHASGSLKRRGTTARKLSKSGRSLETPTPRPAGRRSIPDNQRGIDGNSGGRVPPQWFARAHSIRGSRSSSSSSAGGMVRSGSSFFV
ncbi:hypothetical protein CBR_g38261 [Chara braunii]|uniref:Uncharacterized protein n=1 Tax=Chara braunii TaxID=69332 RepID=A0A388LPU1_CHABU|nr:hypothetical protein CBR_g38261 [Chara braunii]|eukprot:GBG84291.1 hypothetical protein CBR_g38261 [Chara braunii]